MRGWVVVLVAVVGVAACARRTGVWHEVQRGENLYRIGKAYGVSYQELARLNGIANPNRIEVGQRLLVPRASRRLPVGVITPTRAQADRPTLAEFPSGSGPFAWPVEAGRVTSSFGPRGDTHHDGLDIGAPEGTPVRAARAGRVLYSDRLRGYGNLIILEHGQGYASVYAHNSINYVRPGARVEQGQMIATLGSTGKTTGPNLHFEIRKDNVARNPRFYLPAPASAEGGVVAQ